jgi:uncharacterized membrane protein
MRVIEVPPPSSPEYTWLRYGMMTCPQYVWFRAKWVFVSCAVFTLVAVWEFSIGHWWSVLFGLVILGLTGLNIRIALRWRSSWRFWHDDLDNFFNMQRLEASYVNLRQKWYAN